jgi:hypothetical protein
MNFFVIIILIRFNALLGLMDGLPEIQAELVDKSSYTYSESLKIYQEEEKWGWHSGKIGKGYASSELKAVKSISYGVDNIYDLDLNTAWIEGEEGYGLNSFFQFEIEYGTVYREVYFNGVVEIFNGYCKNEMTWRDNSRVKRLLLSINENSICTIRLHDSWHFQSFEINQFLRSNINPNGKYTLEPGDILKFEILEIYPGSKYMDVAISEFVTPSYGGG